INVTDGAEGRPVAVGKRPYDVVQSKNSNRLYVSDWAGRAVLALDPQTLRTVAKIPVGEHSNQIAVHPKDDRIFVACASSNCISVIDTKRGVVTETIYTALFPRAPAGSTPDAVAVAPDGKTLYVANADNNCVAVIDIAVPDKSQVKGFIPTVYRNCPYSDKLLSAAPYPHKTAIPTKVGAPSPIKYVIYIIRENRTYDQVFGDVKDGNGDPSLVMFGEKITPNAHKLAREF